MGKKGRRMSHFKAEPFRDTTHFATKNTILLTLPLLFVIGWFVAVYAIENTMTNSLFSYSCNIFISQQLTLAGIDLVYLTFSATGVRFRANTPIFWNHDVVSFTSLMCIVSSS